MKEIVLFLMFAAIALCSRAEEPKIALIKVSQLTPGAVGGSKPYIEIVNADNTIESIELETTKNSETANSIKLRDAMEKLVQKGFMLITSNSCAIDPRIYTTYVFEKK